MDTTRITDPLTHHLPAPGAIVSTVTDVTSGLADQLTDHISGIDVTDTVRRTRKTLSGVIPWLSPGGSRRNWMSNRWLLVGAAAAVAVAVAVVLRRRSTQQSPGQAGRDDWSTSTPSTNGAAPRSSETTPEREHADTGTTK